MTYTIHTPETAPEAARPILDGAKQNFGFVPNLLGVMAAAPPLAAAYTTLMGLFDQTSLSPTERQVVLLAVSAENGCEYCVAAHSTVAAMQEVPDDVVTAIRDGRPIKDEKLEALRRFATVLTKTRGYPGEEETRAFLDAGYGQAQVLEVVLGIGFKILSNYTNHIAETPLDAAFSAKAWSKTGQARGA